MIGPFLQKLNRISALIGEVEHPVTIFVTSTHFGQIVREMRDFLAGVGATDLPTPANCKELWIGQNVLVVNSTSEDQDAVNIVNKPGAERVNFAYRRDNFRIA